MENTNDSTVITVISGVSRGIHAAGDACLVVLYGDDLGRRFMLDKPELVIGRSRSCDIYLEQESTSRRHAALRVQGGGFSIRDLGSTNGTCVNDETVTDIVLADGDEVRLGRTVMRYIEGEEIEEKYHQALVSVARTDGLTGAANEQVFREQLTAECARARRYGRPLGVALIEFDGFEDYAARTGRIWADMRLRRIVRALRGTLRTSDCVARLGEYRFALLLPETAEQPSSLCAERLRSVLGEELDGLDMRCGVAGGRGEECVDLPLLETARASLLNGLDKPAAVVQANTP
jgi:two-component system, cell cycle response regulator